MQAIAPVTTDNLLAQGQEPLLKLEIYVGSWINLCTLDAKNYVESLSISLGGAGMAPDPVAGTWDAMLSNENGIFHPQHPTSAYKDYCKTGRKTRISIGATYGGTPYYWQRLIGYMDTPSFSAPDYKVSIKGADYMKFLQDAEFRPLDAGEPDNFWGAKETYSSHPSSGIVGSEMYNEVDAMDINNEANNVTNWTPSYCDFDSVADASGGSVYVGSFTNGTAHSAHAENPNVGTGVTGKKYKFEFKFKADGEDGSNKITIQARQSGGICEGRMFYPKTAWADGILYFTAIENGAIRIKIVAGKIIENLRVDQFSIWEYIPYEDRWYQLPGAGKGPYHVTLDVNGGAAPVWQGEEDEGWFYTEDAEAGPDPPAHPAKIVWFDINKTVPEGTDNLDIYYFTATAPEDAVARILFKAGLYVSEAAAKAAMDYTATGITIDKIWFKAGSTYLNAIKKLCERCNYRFYFKYDGTPVFKPKPAGAVVFTFTSPSQIASFSTYQDRNEIKNRIIIQGLKEAEPVGTDDTMPSELQGEASDATSITAYGERTLSIKNDLFQTQAAIDAMCTTLLAEYKDPKWYTDLAVPFNPVPLELGDKIQWEERLSPVLNVTQTGIIRDIKIDKFNTTYKCELV